MFCARKGLFVRPGSVALLPQPIQIFHIANGIHAPPEPGVLEDRKLAVCGKPNERRLLEHAVLIFIQIVHELAPEKEKAGVDPVAFANN